jgi:hypothetical protein
VGDDKGDDEANPVRTHLPRAPSEEHALPERRQVLKGYEQGGKKSICRVAGVAGELWTDEHELPGTLYKKTAPYLIGRKRRAEGGIVSEGPIGDCQE